MFISGRFRPVGGKTIIPGLLGGIAGGTKFMVGGIVFKYACDSLLSSGEYMYGGKAPNDALAMKAAGHELRSATRVLDLGDATKERVSVPLITLIDYRGFRLIALTLMPVSRKTIVYGSDNAGRTIHADYTEFNQRCKTVFGRLNLKKHLVGTKTLYACGDIEGHWGYDNRFYLLDFARLYPSEALLPPMEYFAPDPRAIFFKMLRPELVTSNSTPLCSDVQTGWIRNDPLIHEHHKEVRHATLRLFHEVIPSFAKQLFESSDLPNTQTFLLNMKHQFANVRALYHHLGKHGLTQQMHCYGINMRYLGLVRHHIPKNSLLSTLMLTEMAARVCKNLIRALLREKMKETRVPSAEPYKEVILATFNIFSGASKAAADFWNSVEPPYKAEAPLKTPKSTPSTPKSEDMNLSGELDNKDQNNESEDDEDEHFMSLEEYVYYSYKRKSEAAERQQMKMSSDGSPLSPTGKDSAPMRQSLPTSELPGAVPGQDSVLGITLPPMKVCIHSKFGTPALTDAEWKGEGAHSRGLFLFKGLMFARVCDMLAIRCRMHSTIYMFHIHVYMYPFI
eukprot:TRINITY_DN10051_c0_g1_i1.p1 TRINITY_DN10051_c0_g1~~TRINITY_DN10051_c0_g1_i1.p1  ORF type:complete len:564 (+),score=53.42 TRINITY_DN10051_c0_g1_i1:3-1694(+)